MSTKNNIARPAPIQSASSLPDRIAMDMDSIAKESGIPINALTYSEYIKAGGHYNSAHLAQVGGWKSIQASYFPMKQDFASITRLIDIQKSQKLLSRVLGGNKVIIEDFIKELKQLPAFGPKDFSFLGKRKVTKHLRALHLLLTDLHYGADLKPTATNKPYGKIEEARATAQVVKNVSEYKLDHRSETELHVWLLGDIIEGNIHPSGQASIPEQFARAVHILRQALAIFATQFPVVYVHCATGNHGRNPSVHKERAIDGKAQHSYETMIYFALKELFRDTPHVTFYIPYSSEVVAEVLGHRVYATHGDTLLKIGNPGSSIPTSKIESEINRIDRNEVEEGRKPFNVFLVGHVHKATVLGLDFGGTLIVNGGLPTAGDYTKSVGVHRSQQCQVMFESTEDIAFGDYRRIYLRDTEDDDSLDEIIVPFTGI